MIYSTVSSILNRHPSKADAYYEVIKRIFNDQFLSQKMNGSTNHIKFTHNSKNINSHFQSQRHPPETKRLRIHKTYHSFTSSKENLKKKFKKKKKKHSPPNRNASGPAPNFANSQIKTSQINCSAASARTHNTCRFHFIAIPPLSLIVGVKSRRVRRRCSLAIAAFANCGHER